MTNKNIMFLIEMNIVYAFKQKALAHDCQSPA